MAKRLAAVGEQTPETAAPAPEEPDAPAPRSSSRQRAEIETVPSASAAIGRASGGYPRTTPDTLALVDRSWQRFRAAAAAFPSERMDEHLTERGWTRKQMLAHIAAWHDLTTERLGRMLATGEPVALTEATDAFNARVARQAVGRTAGEIQKEMEMTFNRLRRRIAQFTDEQLAAAEEWAAQVIAGNTYEHYEEHAADVRRPPAADPRSGRR